MDKFDIKEVDNLSNTTKNTKFKLLNLFNIVSTASFSRNLIKFEIDFANSPKTAKVNFKYPMYDILSMIEDNTIFGIYLEDTEIKLFKQIYENYIITIIDDLFKNPIKIPEKSNKYPIFYILMTVRLMFEESYREKYNINYFLSKYKTIIKTDFFAFLHKHISLILIYTNIKNNQIKFKLISVMN